MPRRASRSIVRAALVAGVLALAVWARWPALGVLPPGEDKALNARYLAALRAGEGLPERDPLMLAPDGRAIAHHLPLGMYRAMQAWTALTPASDADTDRLRFGALAALCFVAALSWLGFEAAAGWRGAFATALLSLAIPALTLRTSALWLRWEVLGSAALVAYCAASARALRRGTLGACIASAVLLPIAAWFWRPSLTLAGVALAYGWLRIAAGRLDAAGSRWLAATAAGTVAACVLPAWARHHVQLAGPIGVAALATAVLLVLRRSGVRASRSAWLISVAGAALASAVAARLQGGAFSDLGTLLFDQISGFLTGRLERDAVGRFYATVGEFQPATARFRGDWLGTLLRDDFGLLVVASGLAAALAARLDPRPRDFELQQELGAARGLVGWIALAYCVLTLLFVRSLVVAAPFVAAWAGSGVALVTRRQGWLRALALLLAGAAALHGLIALPRWRAEIGRPGPTLPPGIGAAVAQSTPDDAIVATSWNLGYELQLFANRRSLEDGLGEDPENRRRILEVWSPGAVEAPAVWSARLRSEGVTHVLVGPPIDIATSLLYAGYSKAPGIEVGGDRGFRIDARVPGAAALVQMVGGLDVPGFTRRWTRPSADGVQWSLYEVAPRN
jgi:hypothetical protein